VMEARITLILALQRCRGGDGVATGLRVRICAGCGVCASWGGVQVGFPSCGGQVRVVKPNLGWSNRGVWVGFCEFLGSIL
jgi:hypothetical protein